MALQSTLPAKRAVLDRILVDFRRNPEGILLQLDCGWAVSDQIEREFPERILNMGIREQGSLGVAAGLALAGCVPYVYSIAAFIVFRGLDQLRWIVEDNLCVKVVGYGGVSLAHLGWSHTTGAADIKCLEAINYPIYTDIDEWIEASTPGYLKAE